jgi:hypothetical protein
MLMALAIVGTSHAKAASHGPGHRAGSAVPQDAHRMLAAEQGAVGKAGRLAGAAFALPSTRRHPREPLGRPKRPAP